GRLYEAPIDGSTPPKQIVTVTAGAQRPSSVSADGRFLLYTTNEKQRETKQDMWVLPLKGEPKPFPFVVTPSIENQGVFSPDGKWVAYVSDAFAMLNGFGQIYVRPFPGPGAPRPVSTTGGRVPLFSRDGKKIYFVNGSRLMAADFRSDGKVSEPVAIIQLDE